MDGLIVIIFILLGYAICKKISDEYNDPSLLPKVGDVYYLRKGTYFKGVVVLRSDSKETVFAHVDEDKVIVSKEIRISTELFKQTYKR